MNLLYVIGSKCEKNNAIENPCLITHACARLFAHSYDVISSYRIKDKSPRPTICIYIYIYNGDTRFETMSFLLFFIYLSFTCIYNTHKNNLLTHFTTHMTSNTLYAHTYITSDAYIDFYKLVQ